MAGLVCNGLAPGGSACPSTKLCRAHILPSAFAKRIMGASKKNKLLSLSAVSDTQYGVFDPEILCAACDRYLGIPTTNSPLRTYTKSETGSNGYPVMMSGLTICWC
jgi:hypothetical protein